MLVCRRRRALARRRLCRRAAVRRAPARRRGSRCCSRPARGRPALRRAELPELGSAGSTPRPRPTCSPSTPVCRCRPRCAPPARGRPAVTRSLWSSCPAPSRPPQLSGRAFPPRLPVTEGVERVFLDRDRSRRGSPDPAAGRRRRRLGTRLDHPPGRGRARRRRRRPGRAETSGLITVPAADLALRHPLVRSAVYHAATSRDAGRRTGRWPTPCPAPHDADRRAWHLAAAVDEPDDDVVTGLDSAAERARRRGGHEAARAARVVPRGRAHYLDPQATRAPAAATPLPAPA